MALSSRGVQSLPTSPDRMISRAWICPSLGQGSSKRDRAWNHSRPVPPPSSQQPRGHLPPYPPTAHREETIPCCSRRSPRDPVQYPSLVREGAIGKAIRCSFLLGLRIISRRRSSPLAIPRRVRQRRLSRKPRQPKVGYRKPTRCRSRKSRQGRFRKQLTPFRPLRAQPPRR